MDKKEWDGYVDFVSGGEWPIPRAFICDYDNWLCRSMVGRALYFRGKAEDAMIVLSTVVSIEPSMEEQPNGTMGEAEHKVLCLRDLAKIVWGFTHNTDAALRFWNEAIELCDKYKHRFLSVARGEISLGKLLLLKEAGQEEEAEVLLREMAGSKRFEVPSRNVNSYAYYAYKFMAEREFAKGSSDKAALLLEKAFSFYPMSEAAEQARAQAKAAQTSQERYDAFLQMSKTQYLKWEPADMAEEQVRH